MAAERARMLLWEATAPAQDGGAATAQSWGCVWGEGEAQGEGKV